MPFLRNAWYVAAWASEISEQPLARTLLGEPVVMYRDAEGAPVAASDLCPHRFAPLHLGKVVDGAIECPYHGLRFNAQGRCVFNPDGDGRIPAGARLKTYPMVEKWRCAWIWMGKTEDADPSLIPNYPFLGEASGYKPVCGYLHVRADYRLIIDNLIDAAHLRMVHSDSLFCESIGLSRTALVRDPDGGIWANRLGENGPPPPIFDMMWRHNRGDYAGPMSHWAEAKWNAPAQVMDNTGVQIMGLAREDGLETKNAHFLCPETETTTHYFWTICRDFDLDNPAMDADIRAGTEHAFVDEDEVLLYAVQEAMGDREFWSMKPALLPADIGAVEIRRTMERMIAKEQADLHAGPVPNAADPALSESMLHTA